MSNRDEHGLTLSGRAILRLLIEVEETTDALRDLGAPSGLSESIRNPKVIRHLKTLIWLAVKMVEKIDKGKDPIVAYLKSHEKEDAKTIDDDIKETVPRILKDILKDVMKCEKCGDSMCVTHRVCHHCDDQKSAHGPN